MTVTTRIAEGGRIVLPAEFRRALGVQVGDQITLRLVNGEVRIATLAHAIAHAQEVVRQYVPEGRSLVAELIAERQADSADE